MIEKPKLKTSAVLLQTVSAFSIASLTTLSGFIFAWPSYNIGNFESNNTYLESPMTPMQVSLLGSVVNIGALAVTPFCGILVDRLGRKKSAILFGLPYVITWAIISLTSNINLILAAMSIGGIGCGGQVVSTVYLSEISDDSIRGGLTSFCVSGYFFGLLISYIFGGYLSYHQVVYTHLTLSVLYMLVLMLLRESPVYLVQIGKIQEAEESIAFYRRVSVTSKEVENEINKIKLQLDPNIDNILQNIKDPEEANTLLDNKKEIEIAQPEHNVSSWKFLMKSKSSQRALTCVLSLMSLSIMMGSIVLQVYAEPLLKEAAPSIPSNIAAILLAVDFLVSSSLCAGIVDRLGRRILIIYSSIGSAVFSLLLAVQLQTNFGPPWLTVFIIYGYSFVYTVGATVPFILTAEVFLPEVRGLGNSLSMGCMWIMNFVTLIIFNVMVQYLGLAQMFYFFTVMCVLCAAYSWRYLPETKGLSADAVQLLFYKKE